MTKSMIRYRKVVLTVHMMSIGLWITSSVFIMIGAFMQSKAWLANVYQYMLNPSHMVAMATGLFLIFATRGKLFKRGWFRAKVILLLGSLIMMNVWISGFIETANFEWLIFCTIVYLLLLISIVYLSIKKPRRSRLSSD